MRRFGIAAGCALVLLATSAQSQDFPSSTVRLLVPFAAGGPTDVVARILADLLSARWNKPVVVENRPGAGTIVMTTAVAKPRPTATRSASPPTRC